MTIWFRCKKKNERGRYEIYGVNETGDALEYNRLLKDPNWEEGELDNEGKWVKKANGSNVRDDTGVS